MAKIYALLIVIIGTIIPLALVWFLGIVGILTSPFVILLTIYLFFLLMNGL